VITVRKCLPCALGKTHGKECLCRAPDKKRTAKFFTHGKARFSRSVPVRARCALVGLWNSDRSTLFCSGSAPKLWNSHQPPPPSAMALAAAVAVGGPAAGCRCRPSTRRRATSTRAYTRRRCVYAATPIPRAGCHPSTAREQLQQHHTKPPNMYVFLLCRSERVSSFSALEKTGEVVVRGRTVARLDAWRTTRGLVGARSTRRTRSPGLSTMVAWLG
jgi:hypothetical protein